MKRLCILLNLLLGGVSLSAQPGEAGQITGGFVFPYYDEDNQLRFSLEAESATPGAANQFQLNEMRMTSYRQSPEGENLPQFRLTSASCRFDGENNRAWSDGLIQVAAENGQFSLTGKGWNWDNQKSLLVVSNEIQTTVRAAAAPDGTSPDEPPEPFRVESGEFAFDFETSEARYSKDVAMTQAGRLELKSGRLTAALDPEAGDLKRIDVEENIEIRVEGEEGPLFLQGEQGRYSPGETEAGSESLALTGGARWRMEGSEGFSDRIQLDLKSKDYRAEGNGLLRISPGSKLLPKLPSSPEDESPLEIRFDSAEAQPAAIEFNGAVRANRAGQLRVESDRLTVNRDPENGVVQSLLASQNAMLRIQQEGRTIAATGGAIHLTDLQAEDPQLLLTGDPSWNSDRYSGKADRLRALLGSGKFEAEGNASMILQPTADQADESGGSEFEWLGARTDPIRIDSRSYTVVKEQALFSGEAFVRHPNWSLASNSLTLSFSADQFEITQIVAKDRVRFDHKAPPPPSETAAPRETGSRRGIRTVQMKSRPWGLTSEILEVNRDLASGEVVLSARDSVHLFQSEKDRAMEGDFTSEAFGDWLTYAIPSEELRLGGSPRLLHQNGMSLIGQPDTLLKFDNRAGRFEAAGQYSFTGPLNAFDADNR